MKATQVTAAGQLAVVDMAEPDLADETRSVGTRESSGLATSPTTARGAGIA